MLLLWSCAIGCNSDTREFTDNSRDPEAFAGTVKQMVTDTIADARESKEPVDAFESLVNMFDGKLSGEQLPLGSYQEVYSEILEVSREWAKKCEAADGRPSDLKSGLDKLEQLAGKLPGEAKAARGR